MLEHREEEGLPARRDLVWQSERLLVAQMARGGCWWEAGHGPGHCGNLYERPFRIFFGDSVVQVPQKCLHFPWKCVQERAMSLLGTDYSGAEKCCTDG